MRGTALTLPSPGVPGEGEKAKGPAGALLEVIELGEGDEESVLGAVMRHVGGEIAECGVRPAGGAAARVGVDREGRAVLVGLAGAGLKNLPAIGRAYLWLMENRALLKMAMPQVGMNVEPAPLLWLLLDEADRGAEALAPILRVEAVSVRTYRRVRWGGKTGLLLNAA